MKYFFLFFLIPLTIFSQKEIENFKFEKFHDFESLSSFHHDNMNYVLGFLKNKDGIELEIQLLKFDEKYKFISKEKITYTSLNPKNFIISSIDNINDGEYIINFLKKKNNSFLKCTVEFNLLERTISKPKVIYTVQLSENFNKKYYNILIDNSKVKIIYLQKKEKIIEIYSLNKNSYELKKFTIDNQFFTRLKSNVKLLINSKLTNSFLDTGLGNQFYFHKDCLYIATCKCQKNAQSNNPNFNGCLDKVLLPIHLLEFNLKTGKNTTKELFNSLTKVDFSFSDDKFFFTYKYNKSIMLNYIALSNFQEYPLVLKGNLLKKLDFKNINYTSNNKKVIYKKLDFKSFYKKYRQQPSLAIKKLNDSIFHISLGRVRYRYYNTEDFAHLNGNSYYMGSTNNSLINDYRTYDNHYTLFNNVFPEVSKTEFYYNCNNLEVHKIKNVYNPTREIILDNPLLFKGKKVISLMDSTRDVYLFRDSKKSKYYVYKFSNN